MIRRAVAAAGALAVAGCTGATPDPRDDRLAFIASYAAAVHQARGDHAAAANAYAGAALVRPDSSVWPVAAAEAWIAGRWVARGVAALRREAEARPADPWPRLQLGRVLWQEVGDRTRAAAELRTAERAAPADPRVYAVPAALWAAAGDHRRVAAVWERAEPHVADADGARRRAARAWAATGQHRQALAAWDRMAGPLSGDDLVVRAHSHLALADPEGALAGLPPEAIDIDGWRLRAELLGRLRRFPDAAAAWRRVVELDGEDVEAQVELGTLVLLELGDVAGARPHVHAARRLARRQPPGSVWVRRAAVLAGRLATAEGDRPAAVAAFGEAWRDSPGEPELELLYGRALLAAGEAAAARPRLAAAAAALDSPGGWIGLGDACAALGDRDAAHAAWRRARSAGASDEALGGRLDD